MFKPLPTLYSDVRDMGEGCCGGGNHGPSIANVYHAHTPAYLTEPLPTFLLPLLQLVCWIGLAIDGVKSLWFSAALCWFWSIKNVTQGPQKKDAGAVLFALVFFSQYFEMQQMVKVSCSAIAAANAGYALRVVLKEKNAVLAKTFKETEFFFSVLKPCLVSSAVFWLVGSYLLLRK